VPTGNTLGLKSRERADQSNGAIERRDHHVVCARGVGDDGVYISGITGAYGLYADGVLTGSGTHPIFTTEPVAAATLGPTDGTQVDSARQAYSFLFPRAQSEATCVSHLHMTTTAVSQVHASLLGLQTDNRVLEWGMFTGDRATAPTYNVPMSFASGESARHRRGRPSVRVRRPGASPCESTLSARTSGLQVRCGMTAHVHRT
jgi:hypothetical protein